MTSRFRRILDNEPQPDHENPVLDLIPAIDGQSQSEQMVAGIDALVAQIAAAYEQQARLIRGIGHDFKSPLSSLLHLSEALESGDFGALTEEQRECVHLISRSAQLLMAQAQALYALGEARSNGSAVDREPVDLAVALELVADVSAQRASAKGISFCTELPEGELWVLASTGALERILDNAVNNAIKYTEAGSVTVAARVEDGRAWVAVSDTGIGIPAGEIDRVGQDFTRASNASGVDGSGVGLVVSNHLLAAMGGELHVASVMGEGTTITMVFPLTDPPSDFDSDGPEVAGADRGSR